MTAISITEKALVLGLRNGRYRISDIGLEKRCPDCGDWWPVDDEFYFVQRERGVERPSACCKACYLARYKPRKVSVTQGAMVVIDNDTPIGRVAAEFEVGR